jgi:hypothetical protein
MSQYANPETVTTPTSGESMEQSIRALEDHGFTFESWLESDEGRCALYKFKPNHYTTMFAEVDPTGAVNGDPLYKYLLHNQSVILNQQ